MSESTVTVILLLIYEGILTPTLPAVVETRHNPHIRALYERLLARGKAKMVALGAAMHKRVQWDSHPLTAKTVSTPQTSMIILRIYPTLTIAVDRWRSAYPLQGTIA